MLGSRSHAPISPSCDKPGSTNTFDVAILMHGLSVFVGVQIDAQIDRLAANVAWYCLERVTTHKCLLWTVTSRLEETSGGVLSTIDRLLLLFDVLAASEKCVEALAPCGESLVSGSRREHKTNAFEQIQRTMVRPERLELPTLCSEGRCSIRLSYGRVTSILRQCGRRRTECQQRLNHALSKRPRKQLLLGREVAFAGADLQVFL